MNITIQSVNFKAGTTLEYFIAEKVSKLFKQGGHIIRAEVTLREGDSSHHRNKFCDIRLMIPGNDHIVSKRTDGYEKSVLEAVKTMQQILRSSKPGKMLQSVRSRLYKTFSK